MIDHDAERRQRAGERGDWGQSFGTGQHVEREIAIREQSQIAAHRRSIQSRLVPNPDAEAAKDRIRREAFQLRRKFRPSRFDIAHQANQRFVAGREVEHPLVVFEPRAGFDHHRAGDAEGLGELAEFLRQHGPVQDRVILRWPRHTLRSRGIVEVRVCVDDARRIHGRCRATRSQCRNPEGRGGEKFAARAIVGHAPMMRPPPLSGNALLARTPRNLRLSDTGTGGGDWGRKHAVPPAHGAGVAARRHRGAFATWLFAQSTDALL